MEKLNHLSFCTTIGLAVIIIRKALKKNLVKKKTKKLGILATLEVLWML
jgi:hypothetical protein